jgi:hypothetical protein
MVPTSSVHGIPAGSAGPLSAIATQTLPVAKALDIPRLLLSSSPPLPPTAVLIAHGLGTKVDSHH